MKELGNRKNRKRNKRKEERKTIRSKGQAGKLKAEDKRN